MKHDHSEYKQKLKSWDPNSSEISTWKQLEKATSESAVAPLDSEAVGRKVGTGRLATCHKLLYQAKKCARSGEHKKALLMLDLLLEYTH